MANLTEEKPNHWFLRLEGVQLGPFPSTRVRRMLLDGDVTLQAEISRDRSRWVKIQSVAEVLPPNLRAQLGDSSARSRLHARRIAQQSDLTGERQRFPVTALLVSSLLLGGIIAVSLWKGLPREEQSADCDAKPAPNVNWRNCVLVGVDAGAASLEGANLDSAVLRQAKLTATRLNGANLRYADLSGADLSYAQFTGAVLLGANLRGADLTQSDLREADLRYADLTGCRLDQALLSEARFDGAIWLDGQNCADNSVGACLR